MLALLKKPLYAEFDHTKARIVEIFCLEREAFIKFAHKKSGQPYQEAEDIVQDAFAKLWFNTYKVVGKSEEDIKKYIYGVIKNLSANSYNCALRRSKTLEALKLCKIGSDYDVNSTEIRSLLVDALNCLPPSLQRVVVCFYLKGEKQKEIATKYGISLGFVKCSVSGGVKRMQKHVKMRTITKLQF